jgi:hypothetical protein
MKRFVVFMLTLLLSLLVVSGSITAQEGCTIAVANGSATADGRPLLWKNRDTDDLDQEVRYFDDGSHGGYITIVSTGVDETTTAYVGVNDEGFAIMNANAPDLNTGSPTSHGILMKQALKDCGSVADFESLLVATSGNRGHIWANFGVIDCYGDAAIFETNDWAHVKYDAASEGGFVVRTNFSFWGGSPPGSRYERAYGLISSAADSGVLDHVYVVQVASKDIGGPPSMPCGEWPTTDPAISRYRTRSAAVVHGVLPSEDPRLSTFWCTLGEPSCGVNVPLWSCAGTPPPEMCNPGQQAPLCVEIQQKELYCYTNLTDDTTIDTNELVGDDGLGGIQGYSLPLEVEAFDEAADRLADWRLAFPQVSEIAEYQAERTSRTYFFYDNELAPGDGGKPDADIDIAGTRSGSYLDAWTSDNVYESVQEVETTGNPNKRYSFLEHKWTAFVEPGNQIAFLLEAHHTANSEGDDFVFAYSVDDAEYTDMLVVTKTMDDDLCQSFPLPSSLQGHVYVRVQDTDRTKGNKVLDTVFIDYMFFESSTAPDTTPPLITNVASSGVTGSTATITWDTDEFSSSVVHYDTVSGGPYDFVTSNEDLVLDHHVVLTELSPATDYYYVVSSTDASDNSATSGEHSFTTASGEPELHIAAIDLSLKQSGPFTRAVAEVTVLDGTGSPVGDATVESHWTGLTSDTDQFNTAPEGVGSCESDKLKNPVGWFVLTVDSLHKDGFAYNSAANAETSDSIYVGGAKYLASAEIPKVVALRGSSPNPFGGSTLIRYDLPQASWVTLRVFDVAGRQVRLLLEDFRPAGRHAFEWDGRGDAGVRLHSGLYLVQMRSGEFVARHRVVITE